MLTTINKSLLIFVQSTGSMQFSPVPLKSRNMSPASTPPRRPLPHLMSTSHNGVFGPTVRMTTENGQNIDIYENPSEHYAGFNNGHRTTGSHSPFLPAFRKKINEPDQHSSHGFGKNFHFSSMRHQAQPSPDIQLYSEKNTHLIHKPYVNEVTMNGQNLYQKSC